MVCFDYNRGPYNRKRGTTCRTRLRIGHLLTGMTSGQKNSGRAVDLQVCPVTAASGACLATCFLTTPKSAGLFCNLRSSSSYPCRRMRSITTAGEITFVAKGSHSRELGSEQWGVVCAYFHRPSSKRELARILGSFLSARREPTNRCTDRLWGRFLPTRYHGREASGGKEPVLYRRQLRGLLVRDALQNATTISSRRPQHNSPPDNRDPSSHARRTIRLAYRMQKISGAGN